MPFPKTTEELRSAGYTFLSKRRCAGAMCQAEIELWQTPQGRRIPLDVKDDQVTPHFGNCASLSDFRRKK